MIKLQLSQDLSRNKNILSRDTNFMSRGSDIMLQQLKHLGVATHALSV